MCTKRRRLGQAGFTMVEALAATAIGLVVVGGFLTFHVAQMYVLRNQSTQVDLQTSARSIADLFANEVRRAGTGTNTACTGTNSTGIVTATSSQIRIKADLNGDGHLDGPNEDVTYTLSFDTNTITRKDKDRTDTLWSGASITGSSITYYDSTGTQLTGSPLTAAQLTQITRVKVQVALTGNAFQNGSGPQQTAQEGADAEIRNRYFLMAAQCATPGPPLTSYN